MKSGVREVPDCSGVKGKGFVCFNPIIHSLQLDNESADSAGCVKRIRQQCRPLAVCIRILWMLFLL